LKLYTYAVSPQDEGDTLLAFLKKKATFSHSVKELKRTIDGGLCSIDGKIERFSTHRLRKGQKVTLRYTAAQREKKQPLILLYEDDSILIYDKPPGFVSEPKSFKEKIYLVHRLDKDTSGALIVAKDPLTLKKMIALFAQKKVEKTYLAIVDGLVVKERGIIENALVKKQSFQGQTIWGSGQKGRAAKTIWQCLQKGSKASLLKCTLITGRTHQLRVHFAEMGHPILGDVLYAKRFSCDYLPKRQLLHAYRLSFAHPLTGKMIEIQAPLPRDFLEALDALGMPPPRPI
jgi:RluA family pseudouridine synthase